MAIINKEALDNIIKEQEIAARRKKEVLVSHFELFRTNVLSFKQDMQDILDTEAYLKEIHLEYKTRSLRGKVYIEENKIELSNDGTSIRFWITNRLRIEFLSLDFGITCEEELNGSFIRFSLKDVDPYSLNLYVLRSSVSLMQKFIENVKEFKSSYINCLK